MQYKFTQNFPKKIGEYALRQELGKLLDLLKLTKPHGDSCFRKTLTPIIRKYIIEFYQKLIIMVSEDAYYKRIFLYIPFEVIPNKSFIDQFSISDKSVLQEFITLCRESCIELLDQRDIRANLVDGDIPESGDYKLAEVVKIVHLLPIFIEKDIFTISEVLQIIQERNNDLITNNFLDVLPLLIKNHLISQEQIKNSSLEVLQHCDYLLTIDRGFNKYETLSPVLKLFKNIDLQINNIGKQLEKERSNMTQKRFAWKTEAFEDSFRKKIAQKIVKNPNDLYEIFTYVGNTQPLSIHQVHTICSVIEILFDGSKFRTTLESGIMDMIFHFMNQYIVSTCDNVQNRVKILFHKMYWLGYCNHDTLNQHKVPFIDLFHKPVNHLLEKEALNLLDTINEDPLISAYIHPVIVMYGSAVKGYSLHTTDHDYALFLKPGVTMPMAKNIQDRLKTILGNNDTPLLFMLSDANDKEFIILDTLKKGFGDSTMSHVICNGYWYGELDQCRKLQRTILSLYYSPTNKMYGKYSARYIWLNELERDILQFRLLHRGYYQLYAREPYYISEYSELMTNMDGNTVFYDIGYRRLAFQLFIQHVFI